ncbi:hypothetical protein E4T48_01004 [Aureobasidium sp. EXF-10727]|nr:hypothetical protein E4T48_01004 [Aureobasidium sp. EXF-10727]
MEITTAKVSRQEYLALAYAHQQETTGYYVPFLDILKEVLEDSITSDEAASQVSAFVFSHDDFMSVYLGILSTIIGAAQALSEQRDLFRLAELILALSQLPDARNERSETIRLYLEPKSYNIAPGEVIKIDNARIWCDLPSFSTDLSDSMRGPTAYINDGIPEHIAEQHWTNQNTFAAYLISHSHGSVYLFDYLYPFAFRCLTESLKWDPRTEQGMFSLCSLPAAMRWVCIAGHELWESERWGVAGPLWRTYCKEEGMDEDGRNAINRDRWLWWASRLDDLGESNMIGEEAKATARNCADIIRGW